MLLFTLKLKNPFIRIESIFRKILFFVYDILVLVSAKYNDKLCPIIFSWDFPLFNCGSGAENVSSPLFVLTGTFGSKIIIKG